MRKSKTKGKIDYELVDLRFHHNKHKKSVHQHILNLQQSHQKNRFTLKSRSKQSNFRTSRNSLPVKTKTSRLLSPKMQSPEEYNHLRRTCHQQPKLIKKRLTEYETEQHSASMKITNFSELCRKLIEIQAESEINQRESLAGKIVKNIHKSVANRHHQSTTNLANFANFKPAGKLKKSLAKLCKSPMVTQPQSSPKSNNSDKRRYPMKRLKDNEYYRFE